jgi:hypothetical protein
MPDVGAMERGRSSRYIFPSVQSNGTRVPSKTIKEMRATSQISFISGFARPVKLKVQMGGLTPCDGYATIFVVSNSVTIQ